MDKFHHVVKRRAGEKNFRHAFAFHDCSIVMRDGAPAAAENLDVVCAFFAEKIHNLSKKLNVSAVITGDANGANVFLDRRAHDVAHRAMITEINHFNAVADEFQVDCIDGAIMPVANRDSGQNSNRRSHLSERDNNKSGSQENRKKTNWNLISWLPGFLIKLLLDMADPLDFAGKVVLVTGSSRGIGAEMIKAFGAQGAQCVVNYVADAQGQNKADAMNSAKELNEPLVLECDVTQPAQVEGMMKRIQDRHGGLDILVNNSGIISDRTIKKMSLEDFESVIRVNLIGTFIVTQKAAAILRGEGRIVNLSSVSGQMGLFGQANYSSSKAAIIALTKVSAREFARQNITVNAIAPGFIDVGMSKGMPEEVTQNFIKQIPLGRLGDVSEIVNAALFLASPMASYITGHVLNVNGGFYMG